MREQKRSRVGEAQTDEKGGSPPDLELAPLFQQLRFEWKYGTIKRIVMAITLMYRSSRPYLYRELIIGVSVGAAV